MAIERLAPDAIGAQTNWTGAVSVIQDDPDAFDGNWMTSPAVQASATKTFYMVSGLASGSGAQALQEGGTAPADSAFSPVTGWIVAATAAGRYARFNAATERNATTFSTTVEPDTSGFNVDNNNFRSPSAYTGSFAAGNWVLSAILRSVSAALPAGSSFALRWRLYASTDPTGATNIRELTTSTLETNAVAGTGNTTANHAARTVTWAAPAITLNGEYIFFACAVRVVTMSGTGNSRDLNFRQNANSVITTPAFAPTEPVQTLRVSFPTPANPLTPGAGLQEMRMWARKKGGANNPRLYCQIYENGAFVENALPDTGYEVLSTSGELQSYTWDASGNTATNIEALITTSGGNVAGSNIELGAVEWNANVTAIQALIRSANSYSAAITSGATRSVALQRAANTFSANITAVAARVAAAKLRSANSHVASVTSLANMIRSIGRTATSHIASVTSQVSRLGTAFTRASVSHTEPLTGSSSRVAALTRIANASVANIVAVANWSKAFARSANSHISNITSSSGRAASLSRQAQAYVEAVTSLAQRAWNLHKTASSHVAELSTNSEKFSSKVRGAISHVDHLSSSSARIVQFVRSVQNSVAELTASAVRLQSAFRVVISHVEGLSASVARNTIAYRLAESFVQQLDAYSTQQVIIYLIRTATSFVGELTGASNREGQDTDRSILSGVQDLSAGSSRVTTLVKTATSAVESISAAASMAKGVMRSAESTIDSITSLANRVSSLWRTREESTGEVTGGSSAVSVKVRTAITHVERITSRTNNTSIPKVLPGGMVVELADKPRMVISTADKVASVVRVGNKISMVAIRRPKVGMEVSVAEKPRMTIDLRTD